MATAAASSRLDWLKHPKRDQTLCARRTIWETRDRRYRVVWSKPTLHGLTPVFYAMFRDGWTWSIISRHREKAPAFRAVEAFAREAGV